jgi:hypothetical protein
MLCLQSAEMTISGTGRAPPANTALTVVGLILRNEVFGASIAAVGAPVHGSSALLQLSPQNLHSKFISPYRVYY